MYFEGWQLWFGLALLVYPVLVMVTWSTYRSIRAKSPAAFFRLIFLSFIFTPLMVVFWLIFWLVMAVGLGLLQGLFDPTPTVSRILVAVLLVVVVLVGTPIGWRHLNRGIPDVRDVKLLT